MSFSEQSMIDLRNDIINQQHYCVDSLVKFTLGTFCILSSDMASEFILQNQYKITKKAHNKLSNQKLILKVEKAASDQVFDKCLPVLKGLCISSNSQ